MNAVVLIAAAALMVFFCMYVVAACVTRDRFEERLWVALLGLSGLLGVIVCVLILLGCGFWITVGGQ